jgi:hypothetical protein
MQVDENFNFFCKGGKEIKLTYKMADIGDDFRDYSRPGHYQSSGFDI